LKFYGRRLADDSLSDNQIRRLREGLLWSCWQVESQYLSLHLTHRGASWASGAAQAAHVVRIILPWRGDWVVSGMPRFFGSKPELFFDTILLVLGYLGSLRDSHVLRVVENTFSMTCLHACGHRILLT